MLEGELSLNTVAGGSDDGKARHVLDELSPQVSIIYLSIYLSINLSIYQSVNLSI